MAVEVIGRNIEYGGRKRLEARGGLHLEARDLEHIGRGAIIEQLERRRTEIAAGRNSQPVALEHGAPSAS